MSEFTPEFVIVGNVNQGKSSIVAALIEDGAVPIASYPGTTVASARYSFRQGGQELFAIIDTPGFQDARAALAWMKQRASSPGERPAAVRAFVEAHDTGRDDGPFADELRLLKPVSEGASIIYVVDASSRFQPANEAEMEVLRWTGQPAMALINQTRERDHSEEWRPILEQFFNLVRRFNAHRAGFRDRLDLLRGFGEIREEWRHRIDRACQSMEEEWATRRHKSARAIAEFLVRSLGHVEKRTIAGEHAPPGLSEELDKAYQDRQRSFEQQARQEIEALYQHRDVAREDQEIALLTSDLFSEVSWRLFGLDRAQMARYGLAWGALIGGGVDVAVGGMSFLTGAGVGAVVGGLGGYFAGKQVAKTLDSNSRMARVLFGGETGRFLFKGPVSNPRYAWMLVDRAITHHHAIRDRSHARKDAIVLDVAHSTETPSTESGEQPRVAKLSRKLRDELNRNLMQVIKEARSNAITQKVREDLAHHLDQALQE